MNASKIAYEEDFKIHSNYLGIMLSPFGGGRPGLVRWQGEVILNPMKFFSSIHLLSIPRRRGTLGA